MSRLCSIAEYGLDRVLAVSGNIVKNWTSKFSHRLKITILRERFSGCNTICKSVLFSDIIEIFVLRNFSICIGLKSNCVWLSRLWGLRGLAPVQPSGSPHRPIARFHSNPPTIAEYAPMRGQSLPCASKSASWILMFTTAPLSRFRGMMWRCAVMTK